MAALSAARNTRRRGAPGHITTITAGGTIYQGGLVCRNGSGVALAASDTSGLKVIGVAQHDAVSGDSVTVEHGVFALANGGSYTAANIGDKVYVVDDQTVGTAAAQTNDIPAGVIRDYDATYGVWVDTSFAAVV